MSFPIGVFATVGEPDTPKPEKPKASKRLKTPKSIKPSEKPESARGSTDEPRSVRGLQFFKKSGKKGSPSSSSASSFTAQSAALLTPTSSRSFLARSQSVLSSPRSRQTPLIISDRLSDKASLDPKCSPEPVKAPKPAGASIPDGVSPSTYYRFPAPFQRAKDLNSPSRNKARHLEIEKIYADILPLGIASTTVETSVRVDSFTPSQDMDRSTTSSRTSTLDSATSAPSPNQLYSYSRKGSSAQLSINSSQSSLAGRDDYASEQESLQSGHTSNSHHGRPNAASPAIGNGTPNLAANLSSLVCNVHRTTGKEPSALVGATTTILGDKLYVFGGRRISRSRPNLTSDLYELDLLHRHWTRINANGDVPSPRYFHSICALGDSKLVCYGGMSPEPAAGQATTPNADGESQVTVMSDIHIYDVPTFTWTKINTSEAPQGRYAHCAAILPSSAVFGSANAPVSALHNNASGANPNQGSIGVTIDGTGGAEMIVVGGQDSSNHYIEQISVFNLRSLKWTSTTPMSGRSCGAYRSVVTPLTTMGAAKIGAGPGRPDEEEDDGDDDEIESGASGSPMLIYTNYNFLDVKLELQVRLPDGSLVDKPMQGAISPPGLRFPSGGIIDNHFVVAGTFLTSSKQEFSLWALDLRTLAWARIDTGSSIFSQGSWNRGVLWNRRNAFVILGNRKRNLVEDYNNRRLNFSNVCIVQLEAFGLYDNPRKSAPTSDYISGSAPLIPPTSRVDVSIGGRQISAAAESLGELSLSSRELADMDFLAIDGTRIPVNSRLVARRWGPSFNALLRDGASAEPASDTATLRPGGSSVFSRNSSITITPSLSSTATTLTANTATSATSDMADTRHLPPTSRPRILYLPHTVPTIQSLLHYLYTSSLPPLSSPLANAQIFCSLLQLAIPYKIDGLLEAVIERLHEILDGRNAAAIFNAAAMGAGGGQGVAFSSSSVSSASTAGMHPPRTVSLGGIESLNFGSGRISGLSNGIGNGHLDGGGAAGAGAGAINGRPSGPLRIDTDVANGRSASAAMRRSSTATTQTALTVTASSASGSTGQYHENGDGSQAGDVAEDEDDVPDSASTAHSMASAMSSASGRGRRREEREIWDGGWSAVIGLQKRGLRGLMEGRRAREGRSRADGSVGAGPGVGVGGGAGVGGAGAERVGLGIV